MKPTYEELQERSNEYALQIQELEHQLAHVGSQLTLTMAEVSSLRSSNERVVQERNELAAQVERLRGIKPEFPPHPGKGGHCEELPRYGLRWNGPDKPLTIPMLDGYWTPYHMVEALKAQWQAEYKEDALRYRWIRGNCLSVTDLGATRIPAIDAEIDRQRAQEAGDE